MCRYDDVQPQKRSKKVNNILQIDVQVSKKMLLIIISNTVGTESLHIYLHSKNMVCLHVGVIGVCNLCVHTRHEVILTKY